MKRFGKVNLTMESDLAKKDRFPGIIGQVPVADLMTRVLEKDDYDAFQLLFHRMYNPLCSFCEKFVQVKEVAEEIVSDVFYTIWKNRHRIKVISPKSYLYTAVRNRGFDYLRSFNRNTWCELEQAAHLPADNHTLLEAMEHAELEVHLNHCIGLLPKQCKIIFELSRDEGLKYREIAEELSISVKTVEAQMGRALKYLRKAKEAVISQ